MEKQKRVGLAAGRKKNSILGGNDDRLDCPLKGLPVCVAPGSSSSYGGGAFVSPPSDPPTPQPAGARQPMITWMAADIFIKRAQCVCVVFVCVYLRTIKVNL